MKNISKGTMQKYSFIEWNMIKGLRNRIVHDYEGISLKSIGYVLNHDIIQLKQDIQKNYRCRKSRRLKNKRIKSVCYCLKNSIHFFI